MQPMTPYDILRKISHDGKVTSPRGQDILELEYFQCKVMHPWSWYTARNYPIEYFKREFQWYLEGDPHDQRICQWAKMWKKLIQDDGTIYSNYGQYWFGWQKGFDYVLETLSQDPDSRRAYIPMCNSTHMRTDNSDMVCTKGIQFRLHNNRLNIHVAMRSSDAIWGMATDLPCFWYLWEMVACDLGVRTGEFVFSADSIHVYDRHWHTLRAILNASEHDVHDIDSFESPPITDTEDLISGRFESQFGRWLAEVEL